MSLLSLLAAAIVAKIRPDPPDVEITRLKAQIDDLKAQIDDLKRGRNEWYGMAVEWRARYYGIRDRAPIALGGQHQHHITEEMRQALMHQAQAQMQSAQLHQQAILSQMNAQDLQNAQNQQPLFQVQGLMNQIDSFVDGAFCNCTPGRHQILTKR